MNILLKYATRSRPKMVLDTIEAFRSKATGKHTLQWLFSVDYDDETMNNPAMLSALRAVGTCVVGESPNKIHAMNRDFDAAPKDWEIMVNAQDDFRAVLKGWDDVVAKEYATTLDRADWFIDGFRFDLCTLCVFGREAFEKRLNRTMYHPAFVSVFADNFYMHCMQQWGILKRHSIMVFRHMWKHENDDALMARNEDPVNWAIDQKTLERLTAEFDANGGIYPAC